MRVHNFVHVAVVVLFALLIQGQVTFGREAGVSLGLTINLADVLIPVFGGYVLAALGFGWGRFPVLIPRLVPFWFIAVTLLFAFGILNGVTATDTVSSWALINRGLGWLVVVCYFYAIAYLQTNAAFNVPRLFFGTFAIGVLMVSVVNSAGIIYADYHDFFWLDRNSLMRYPLDGLTGNRNLFGLFFLTALIPLTVYRLAGAPLLRYGTDRVFYGLLPLFLGLNGSRTIQFASIVLVLGFIAFYRQRFLRTYAASLGAGVALAGAIVLLTATPYWRENQVVRFQEITAQFGDTTAEYSHPSDLSRTVIYREAITLWLGNPILGAGIGAHAAYQKAVHGHIIDLIDSTPLWLLCELGLVGLLFLTMFFAMLLRKSLMVTYAIDRSFALSVLFIMILFLMVGMLHQLFYTRYIWLVLGLVTAISMPVRSGAAR